MRALKFLPLIAVLALPGAADAKNKPPKHKPAKHKPAKPQTVTTIKNGGAFPKPNPVADPNAPCANTDLVPSADNVALVQAAILCLVNQQRALQNLGALKDNPILDGVAQAYSATVVQQDNFSHTGTDGSTPITRVLATTYVNPKGNYQIGENLGAAESTLGTPSSMVTAWMNSPEHRANILDPRFQESGIGVTLAVPASQSTGNPIGVTYVQDFGVRGMDLKKTKKPSGGSSPVSFGR
jgi:uncharacterized protein YkwD